MKSLIILISFVLLQLILSAQNIENRLGSSGHFVVESSVGIPIVAFNENGQMSTVGRTNRLITGNEVVLGNVYLEVIDHAFANDLNLEFITEPSVGTEHLIVIKDMNGEILSLNLLGDLLSSHQWISADSYFDPGDGSTIATISNFNGGTNNRITYVANGTPPGTMIKIIYLGNGLWTAGSNFLSTYSPPTK